MPCPVTVGEFRIARLLPLLVVELQRRRVRYVVPSGDVGELVDLRSEPAPRLLPPAASRCFRARRIPLLRGLGVPRSDVMVSARD